MTQANIPLESVRTTADRVVRLAHALYGGAGADVVWREGQGHARTKPFEGDGSPHFPSRRVIATGEALWIEDFATDPVAQAHGLAPGSPEVKAFLGAPILCDGEVLGALISIDMTPRPRVEKVLKQFQALAALLGDDCARVKLGQQLQTALETAERSERRLRAAMRIAKIRVWELDHLRREAVSERAERDSVDYDLAMEKLWAPVHPEDLPGAQQAWEDHLAGGEPMHVVHRHVRSDGALRWVESLAEAHHDDQGRLVSVVGAVRDIDQEKRNELELVQARLDAEAESEAKSRFLATVSHEIRTPLNGIYGMAQALAREDLPEAQQRQVEVICRSSESLLAIINDVLDLSKISVGKVELEAVDFDVVELATGVCATFAALSAAKGLQVKVTATPSVAAAYRGDAGRLRQVLSNLLSNAVKFTAMGGVTVALDQTPDGLVIGVTDTGIGIAPDNQARIFEPFVQADVSTTRRFGGTGLGLAICRELVAAMGGALSLESRPAAGSCFKVQLPLTPVSAQPPAAPSVAGQGAEGPAELPALRVLAAEDNSVNQLVLATLLGQMGVEPTFVSDGVAALDAWRREAWDLILMDAQMPVMDGLEATRRIRAEEGRTGRSRTPIIALTANALNHQVAEYAACGMDEVVPKPIEIARLVEAMNAVLAA